jgi:hypothetical protein
MRVFGRGVGREDNLLKSISLSRGLRRLRLPGIVSTCAIGHDENYIGRRALGLRWMWGDHVLQVAPVTGGAQYLLSYFLDTGALASTDNNLTIVNTWATFVNNQQLDQYINPGSYSVFNPTLSFFAPPGTTTAALRFAYTSAVSPSRN